MRPFRCRAAFVFLLASIAPALRADATLRYHTDIKAAGGIGIAMPLNQALGGMRDTVIRVKGNKAYSSQGNVTSIMDLKSLDLILVDAPNKRFASVPSAQYAQQVKAVVPAVPPQASAILSSMKSKLESRSTGRTAVIQGIQAEEREFVLTMDMALPGGPPTNAPFMKMVMQVWTAKPGEAQRVPALQELNNYMASASASMNPAETIKQMLSALPGMGDGLGAMAAEMKNGGMMLRMHTELFMPVLALMSRQLPQQPGQPPPPTLDPNAPLMEMNQEVVELSTTALDDSLFQVPQDYQPASLEDVLKSAVPGLPSAPPPPPAPAKP